MELPLKPEIIVLLGRPASGKSYCIKSMIYSWAKANHMKFGLCVCPTAFNGDYSYLPDKWVWDEYDEDKLARYVERLREKTKKLGKEKMPPNFVILDDLLGKINWNSKFWTSWIATFRHTNTTLLISAQSLKGKGTSTLLRDCTSRALMYYTNFKSAVEGLFDAYGQIFPNIDEFKKAYRDMTREKHQCMVYVNNQDSFDDSYFSLIAAPVEDFKLEY